MIRVWTEEGGWYGDCTLEGDYVSLHRDSHLVVNGSRVELPPGQSNLLQLVALNWRGQVLIAGQGQSFNNWLYKDGKWNDLGPSFATFSCAFSPDYLYYVCGPNQYRSIDLDNLEVSPVIPRIIGANGIRYIDFNRSIDGIVTGDVTYGPSPYNLSQWTALRELVLGQSYIDGAICSLLNKRYKVENGDTQFLRLHTDGSRLCIAIVKMLEKKTVFYWMDYNDLSKFPLEGEIKPLPPSEVEPGPINMNIQAPIKITTVQRMMRLHPEINTMDDNERGKIIDYFCNAENPVGSNKPWGRKARNKDGSNKNTDGLTYLLDDGRFEIYDVISGGDGSATWDYAGTFKQGENGYWAEGETVNDTPSIPVGPDPIPDPVEVKIYTPIHTYEEMINFATSVQEVFHLTKLGKTMNALPEHTLAHIYWRYFFESENYSNNQLLDEVRLRGNEEWRD